MTRDQALDQNTGQLLALQLAVEAMLLSHPNTRELRRQWNIVEQLTWKALEGRSPDLVQGYAQIRDHLAGVAFEDR